MCAQSHALGTHTKIQLEILTINVIYGIVYFREIILESSGNMSETIPRMSQKPTFHEIEYPLTNQLSYQASSNNLNFCFTLVIYNWFQNIFERYD